MDNQNAGLMAPAPQESLIYITLQVRHSRGNDALQFYQNAFGAVVEHRTVSEMGLMRPRYSQLLRTFYLRFNAHIIFRVVEVEPPANLAHDGNMLPCIYVNNPSQLVQQVLDAGATLRRTEIDGDDIQLTLLRDPFGFLWSIGSANPVPNLY